MFRDSLIRTMEVNERKRSDNQYSNEEMIRKQKEELKALEIEEANKKKREREELERIKREEQEKIKEELTKQKKKTLSPEPSPSDPNSTLIIFRYPDWSTRVERRFLKTEKIQVIITILNHNTFINTH